MNWDIEMSVRILHFADAHIDSYSGGKMDPNTGLSVHTLDFIRALDEIIDTAMAEDVRLVLFAGDAYRGPTPVPTFQREWQRRIARLSEARIPILMIPGNHDVPGSTLKATALQELDTLHIPYVHLSGKGIHLWTPQELDGVPLQVLAVPWFPMSLKSGKDEKNRLSPEERAAQLTEDISLRIRKAIEKADKNIPLILLTHYAVHGSLYPSGQTAELGRDVTLSRALVCDPAFSYTALGHIHLFQDLNEGKQPPAVYSGSIERVNYGEAKEKKGFIIADVSCGHTDYEFRELHTRRMYNLKCQVSSPETMQQELLDMLPSPEKAKDAMIRLEFTYDHEWESMLNERELRSRAEGALDFQLIRNPVYNKRIRIKDGNISSQTPADLLRLYCTSIRSSDRETEALCSLAEEIFAETASAVQEE